MRFPTAPILTTVAALLIGALPAAAAAECETLVEDRCETWSAIHKGGRNETLKGNFPEEPKDVAVAGSAVYITGESFDGGLDSALFILKYSSKDGTLLWETRYDGRNSVEGFDYDSGEALTVSGGSVFVTGYRNSHEFANGDLVVGAFDRKRGKKQWVVAVTKGRSRGADITTSNDGSVVFITGNVRHDNRRKLVVAALDARNGKLLWKVHEEATSEKGKVYGTELTAGENRLFVQGRVRHSRRDYDYVTLAYDISRTRPDLAWRTFTHSAAPGYGHESSMALAPDGSRLYVGGSHQVFKEGTATAATYALDATDGSVLWVNEVINPKTQYQSGYDLTLSPEGNTVYVVGVPDVMPSEHFENFVAQAYASDTGATLWTTKYESGDDAVIAGDIEAGPDGPFISAVLVETQGRSLLTLSLDGKDGSIRWSARFKPSDDPSAELHARETLAVGKDGSAYIAGEMNRGRRSGVYYDKADLVVAAYR